MANLLAGPKPIVGPKTAPIVDAQTSVPIARALWSGVARSAPAKRAAKLAALPTPTPRMPGIKKKYQPVIAAVIAIREPIEAVAYPVKRPGLLPYVTIIFASHKVANAEPTVALAAARPPRVSESVSSSPRTAAAE